MPKKSDRSPSSRRNPPAHTRFKPGESGNPKGRPKGRKNLKTVIEKELATRVTLTENGKPIKATKQEIIIRRLVHDSMKGQHRATDLVLRLLRELFSADQADDAASAQISQPDRATLRRIKARLDGLVSDEDQDSEDARSR